jgi:hypothetical protein
MNTETDIKTGIIYKLCSLNTDKCYIGSTTQKLTERFKQHNNNYRNFCNGVYHYVTSFEIVKAGNPFIIEIERVIGNKQAILTREGYYIENTVNCVNKLIAGRTQQERSRVYYENNKEKIIQYRDTNKDKILQQRSVRNICELCGGKFLTKHKSTHYKTKLHLKKI